LAEYEVVAQFKESYQVYANLPFRNTNMLTLLEKLFQDSKKIRTEHLTEIGQLSYAGIARKIVHTKSSTNDVLVVGSGNLAIDLVKLLKKKHRVFLTARNTGRVGELCSEHSLEMIPWRDYDIYKNFESVVNTIGTEEILFNEDFFHTFSSCSNASGSKLFIDLGSPSVIRTHLSESAGVFRLEDIFRQSAKMNNEKMEKIKCAKDSIVRLCENRRKCFSMSHPFGWEELQLA
jgi:glutamyl-tRNA reductase